MIKRYMILLMVVAIICFAFTGANATKVGVAGGFGVSSVGSGGDYANLYDCATDFNNLLTGLTGNWTILILSSISETTSTPIGNATNGFTLTIKPAISGVTVTWTQPTDNTGVTGNLIIGARGLANLTNGGAGDIVTTMSNVVIDGSSNGTKSQDLTLTNLTTIAFSQRMVRVMACRNITVKNLISINVASGASAHGIAFTPRNDTVSTSIISNVLIDNCIVLQNGLGGSHAAIDFEPSGTLPAGFAIDTAVITNCFISGRTRGILFFANAGGTVSNCTIRMNQWRSNTLHTEAILHTSPNTPPTGWTMNWDHIFIDRMSTINIATNGGLTGLYGNVAGGTYNINNNIVGGFVVNTAATSNGTFLSGIRMDVQSNANIYNNSVYVANQAALLAQPTTSYSAGLYISSPTSGATFVNVKNNIIAYDQVSGVAFYSNITTPGFLYTSDKNDIYAGASTYFAIFNGNQPTQTGVTCANLAALQAASGQDAGSQSVYPFTTSPSAWVSAGNLHFNALVSVASAAPLALVPVISGITTDIDGQQRLNPTWPGADELVPTLVVSPTQIFAKPSQGIINMTAVGGIAPINWVISSGTLGTLSTGSGLANTYTPGGTATTGTITITDSAVPAQVVVVPVVITATSAPLVGETAMLPATSKAVVRFDLFR